MKKLSLIYEIEGIITPLIDPNITPHTSLDKISSVRRTQEIPIHRVGGARTGLMGYVVMKVQIEGVPSYGEDQVFLVVDDNSAYSPSDTRYTHHQSRGNGDERVGNVYSSTRVAILPS